MTRQAATPPAPDALSHYRFSAGKSGSDPGRTTVFLHGECRLSSNSIARSLGPALRFCLDAAAGYVRSRLLAALQLIVHFTGERTLAWLGWPPGGHPRLTGAGGGRPKGRPPTTGSSQQAACARGFSAAGQARAAVRTLIVAASLSTRRRRALGMTASSGGTGDGADAVGMSTLTLEPLVTASAVTVWRNRKVARNVLR